MSKQSPYISFLRKLGSSNYAEIYYDRCSRNVFQTRINREDAETTQGRLIGSHVSIRILAIKNAEMIPGMGRNAEHKKLIKEK